MSAIWKWLSLKKNQTTLSFIGAGVVVVVAAVWKAFFSHAEPPMSASAPNGIAIVGSTVNNPVVNNNHAVREINGLYQGDNKVGVASPGPSIDDAKNVIAFGAATFESYPNPAQPIEYQNLMLQCDVSFLKNLSHTVGSISIGDFKCTIVGHGGNASVP